MLYKLAIEPIENALKMTSCDLICSSLYGYVIYHQLYKLTSQVSVALIERDNFIYLSSFMDEYFLLCNCVQILQPLNLQQKSFESGGLSREVNHSFSML